LRRASEVRSVPQLSRSFSRRSKFCDHRNFAPCEKYCCDFLRLFFCYFVAILLRFSPDSVSFQMAEYSGIHTIPHVFWITCTAM
jgi:hypothetical protein